MLKGLVVRHIKNPNEKITFQFLIPNKEKSNYMTLFSVTENENFEKGDAEFLRKCIQFLYPEFRNYHSYMGCREFSGVHKSSSIQKSGNRVFRWNAVYYNFKKEKHVVKSFSVLKLGDDVAKSRAENFRRERLEENRMIVDQRFSIFYDDLMFQEKHHTYSMEVENALSKFKLKTISELFNFLKKKIEQKDHEVGDFETFNKNFRKITI